MGLAIACACLVGIVVAITLTGGFGPIEERASAEDAPTAMDAEEGVGDVAPFTVSEEQQAALSGILGSDLTAQLVGAATIDADANWIATHPEAYAVDGDRVQFKLLRLAASEPEAIGFVRAFPDRYPMAAGESCEAPGEGEVPHLYQWDPRWGYTVYSSTTFALTGCCPTAMAMVYQGLTGNGDLSPYDMGQLASSHGYMSQYSGTDEGLLYYASGQLGLICEQRACSTSELRSALEAGQLVIINVGPGDFTDGGHYIVACGLDGDGQVVVNDPFSVVRSSHSWSAESLISQSKTMFAFYRA